MRTGKVSNLMDKEFEVFEGIQELMDIQEEKKREEEELRLALRKFVESKTKH